LRIMTVDKTARMLMLVVACMLFSMICWTMLARS
jgi:hypothetical protein